MAVMHKNGNESGRLLACAQHARHRVACRSSMGCLPGNLNLLATGQVVYYTTNNTGTAPALLLVPESEVAKWWS